MSPFDPSSQQFTAPTLSTLEPSPLQSQIPLATPTIDPLQVQQYSTTPPQLFDPSTQILQQQIQQQQVQQRQIEEQQVQQQIYQDQTATILANQSPTTSQQFTNDPLAQSIYDAGIQNANSHITSSSPVPVQYTPDPSGQSLMNASIQAENSYITAPTSYTSDPSRLSFLNSSIQDDNSYIDASTPTVDAGSEYCTAYDALAAQGQENALSLLDTQAEAEGDICSDLI
jgi:hypothetical protein